MVVKLREFLHVSDNFYGNDISDQRIDHMTYQSQLSF